MTALAMIGRGWNSKMNRNTVWLLTSDSHDYHQMTSMLAVFSTRGKAVKGRACYAKDNDLLDDNITYAHALSYTRKVLVTRWYDLTITKLMIE